MDIIARVEVPINNSGTCSYYIECCTEEEVNDAYKKARNNGHSASITWLVKRVAPVVKPVPTPILFDLDDEEIII